MGFCFCPWLGCVLAMTLVASKVASSKPARIPLKICILENTEVAIHPVGLVSVVVEVNDQRRDQSSP